MAYPRRLLSEGEDVIKEFRPHWRMLAIPLGWTILAIAVVAAIWMFTDGLVGWILTAIVTALWLKVGLWSVVNWFFTLYIITNERLITRRGVISRSGLEIPLENINDIKFSQNVLERVLRSGDLLIESAGEMGQSRFSDIPEPEDFQALIYRVREERAAQLSGGGGPPDATTKLERLARLHREGALTDEEFEAKKQELLGEI
ncbi:MAG: PH domain-containing protein [Acidimicrobiia bacterium]|nr:PH domain-containing protein [Acidimicrobiia bacterium]